MGAVSGRAAEPRTPRARAPRGRGAGPGARRSGERRRATCSALPSGEGVGGDYAASRRRAAATSRTERASSGHFVIMAMSATE